MKQLNPNSVWLFFLSSSIGTILSVIPMTFIFGFNFGGISPYFQGISEGSDIFWIAFLLSNWWIVIILTLIVNFVWSKLTYHFYRYELTSDGFRKEHGIIWKKYVTIPYERIQNVDIYRGLLARILKLSDLNIQTAGMSSGRGSYGAGSEGRLPGLSPEVAEQLRNELVKRARGKHKNF